MDIITLISKADIVVQSVILVLIIMSIVSWALFSTKFFAIKWSRFRSIKFYKNFMKSKDLDKSYLDSKYYKDIIPMLYASGYVELKHVSKGKLSNTSLDNIERAMVLEKENYITKLSYSISFLATTASIAPFIGLFGTVWGIMNAFIGLSQQSTVTIAAVAPGIAEALIATAIGLFAAIPAVVFYNKLGDKIETVNKTADGFIYEFLNIIYRTFIQEANEDTSAKKK